MKFFRIFIGGLILSLVLNTQAQTDMSALFSSDNKNIIYAGKAKDYTGSPLVFIEGISDKPQPKDWKDELKIKLFGSMELPKDEIQKPLPPLEQDNIQNSIKINALFGGEKEVLFVPHTSDWNFIIQILNDEEIIIQEDIQFIKTDELPSPVRNWPKQNLQLLETQINGQTISPSLVENEGALQLKMPELGTGVHKIHLIYLIRNAGIFSKNTAQISLPLTDMGWSLPTASMNGVVLFPKNVEESNIRFLFGKNQQEIKEAFITKKDQSGSLFFHASHLLPAHSIIQLNLSAKFTSFITKGIFDKMLASPSFLIFIISLGIILFYLILNVIEVKITPVEEVILRKKYRIISNPIFSFFYRTGEMWIGLILLWSGSLVALYFKNAFFSFLEIKILILIPIAFILIIDYLLLYPRQKNIQKMKGHK